MEILLCLTLIYITHAPVADFNIANMSFWRYFLQNFLKSVRFIGIHEWMFFDDISNK